MKTVQKSSRAPHGIEYSDIMATGYSLYNTSDRKFPISGKKLTTKTTKLRRPPQILDK